MFYYCSELFHRYKWITRCGEWWGFNSNDGLAKPTWWYWWPDSGSGYRSGPEKSTYNGCHWQGGKGAAQLVVCAQWRWRNGRGRGRVADRGRRGPGSECHPNKEPILLFVFGQRRCDLSNERRYLNTDRIFLWISIILLQQSKRIRKG